VTQPNSSKHRVNYHTSHIYPIEIASYNSLAINVSDDLLVSFVDHAAD